MERDERLMVDIQPLLEGLVKVTKGIESVEHIHNAAKSFKEKQVT